MYNRGLNAFLGCEYFSVSYRPSYVYEPSPHLWVLCVYFYEKWRTQSVFVWAKGNNSCSFMQPMCRCIGRPPLKRITVFAIYLYYRKYVPRWLTYFSKFILCTCPKRTYNKCTPWKLSNFYFNRFETGNVIAFRNGETCLKRKHLLLVFILSPLQT